ncbi:MULTISPECIES: hypothetical protein [unclassified Corynebacterium]|uniref:DUF6918 family protein n=1 Tax=unclassified Corynebacterium TaxID=2624378 RepID=UPI003523DF71
MTDLKTQLTGSHRDAVVTDMATFIDSSVADLSGLTGMAIKGAVGAARKADANVVSKGVSRLLPELCEALDPHWQNYRQGGPTSDFGTYLDAHRADVTDSILAVADRNAGKINQPAISKVYSSVRGKLTGIIGERLNGLGRIIEKYAA